MNLRIKKTLISAVLLTGMLSTAVLPASFAAEQQVTISASKETAKQGEEFTVELSFSDIPANGIDTYSFSIKYDTGILDVNSMKTQKSVTEDTADVSVFDYSIDENNGMVNVIWTTGNFENNCIHEDGVFAVLSGTVSQNAADGTTADIEIIPTPIKENPDSDKINDKIKIGYIDDSSQFYYDCKISNGSVTIGDTAENTTGNTTSNVTLWGDADANGEIDITDVVIVAAFSGNSSKNQMKSQGIINADVHNNGDGITANDALAIQQYLANIIESLPV